MIYNLSYLFNMESKSVTMILQDCMWTEVVWAVVVFFGLLYLLNDMCFLQSRVGRHIHQVWVQSDANGTAYGHDSTTSSQPLSLEEKSKVQANEMLAKWARGLVLPSLNETDKNALRWHPNVSNPFKKDYGSYTYDEYLSQINYKRRKQDYDSNEDKNESDKKNFDIECAKQRKIDLARFTEEGEPGFALANLTKLYADRLISSEGKFNKSFEHCLENRDFLLSIHTFGKDIPLLKTMLTELKIVYNHFIVTYDADDRPLYSRVCEVPQSKEKEVPAQKGESNLVYAEECNQTRTDFENYVLDHPSIVCLVQEDFNRWNDAGKDSSKGKTGWTSFLKRLVIRRVLIWDDVKCWSVDDAATFSHVNPFLATTDSNYFQKLLRTNPWVVLYEETFWFLVLCISTLATSVSMMIVHFTIPFCTCVFFAILGYLTRPYPIRAKTTIASDNNYEPDGH